MSKIEDFKKEQWDHSRMSEALLKCQNLPPFKDSSRDKFGVSLGGKWHDHGQDMGFLTAYQGFYGSSSCSAYDSPRMAKYILMAINEMMPQLAKLAIEYSELDVEKKRVAAENEAKSVLKEVANIS
jgi:hypothetical protein